MTCQRPKSRTVFRMREEWLGKTSILPADEAEQIDSRAVTTNRLRPLPTPLRHTLQQPFQ